MMYLEIDPQKSAGVRWRRRLGIKLGVFYQHEPRELPSAEQKKEDTSNTRNLPSISIVTPSCNHGIFIGSTVQSVLSQEYPNLQYVIQDAESTDCTPTVLGMFSPGLFELNVEPDAGQADAINKGFRKCDGEILGYLNSDDLLLGNALKTVGEFFRDNPAVDVVYGNRLIIDSNGKNVGRWILPRHDGKVLRWVDYVPQETLFWRRRAWEQIGGFVDDQLNFAIDWDLLLRFEKNGAVFAHLPNLLGAFRVHCSQKSNALYDSIGRREMDSIRRKYRNNISKIALKAKHCQFLINHFLADRRFIG